MNMPYFQQWKLKCWITVLSFKTVFIFCCIQHLSFSMSPEEKSVYRNKAKEMFFHGYDNYMKYAYPADELMPLSCKGRYRGSEPSRGDIDDALGNFSLSLVDSLDTLFIMNETDKFEDAVQKVIGYVHFDRDVIVSVFEINIRMLGGLLGGHVAVQALQRNTGGHQMAWYTQELLQMAEDLGRRLLPAFNTSTGIPYPRVNLKYGLGGETVDHARPEVDTCTACAGSMILEFAALSRLTGDPIFEAKAERAMNYLWEQRNRHSDLMGTVINIHNGNWVRRESGVGAGIDSYYEYLFKAYVLLGDEVYLHRFNTHYDAIQRYVSTLSLSAIPMLIDVQMHRPLQRAKNFMDSLLAFWPGLQVMTGDIKPAIALHEILYQVVQRHNFLPEAFTTDFHVHWGQHPLRPEFIESNYFLYRATGDPYYLRIGAQMINNLDRLARVECGFAAIQDVRTMAHIDQMDSFVLAETFKYLYLLFTEPSQLPLNLDEYVFTTEAHLLPISLSQSRASSAAPVSPFSIAGSRQCLNLHYQRQEGQTQSRAKDNPLFSVPSVRLAYAEDIRFHLKDVVSRMSPTVSGEEEGPVQILTAEEFKANNPVHLELLKRMGIQVVASDDGQLQLFHHPHMAKSETLASMGTTFMTEMIKLNQQMRTSSTESRYIYFLHGPHFGGTRLLAGPAQFGPFPEEMGLEGEAVLLDPLDGCVTTHDADLVKGKIGVVRRGGCMFVEKARNLMKMGAIGGIVIDSTEGSSSSTQGLFAMSGDGTDDVTIPMAFLFHKEGAQLIKELEDAKPVSLLLTKTRKEQGEVLRRLIKKRLEMSDGALEETDSETLGADIQEAAREADPSDGAPLPEAVYRVTMDLLLSTRPLKSVNEKAAALPDRAAIRRSDKLEWELVVYPTARLAKLHDKAKAEPDKFLIGILDFLIENTNFKSLSLRNDLAVILRGLIFAVHAGTGVFHEEADGPRLASVFSRAQSQLTSKQMDVGADVPTGTDKYLIAFVLRAKRSSPKDSDYGQDDVMAKASSQQDTDTEREKTNGQQGVQGEKASVVDSVYSGEEETSATEPSSVEKDDL